MWPIAIRHGQHGEAEGECDAQEADAEAGKGGGEHRAAAASEDQPEGSDEFRQSPVRDWHVSLLLG